MNETFRDILIAFITAMSFALLATLLKERKAWMMAQLAALIQRTEKAVQGSGMGAEKKRLVLAQLETMGIKVTAWVSDAIDRIVAALNEKRAWIIENTQPPDEGDGTGN